MSAEPKPTLYLVDDEPDQLFLIIRAAERSGEYGEIRTAIDSHQAYQTLLDLAEHGALRPSLVVTDWKMPGLTGAELACALTEHPQLKDIPVVALSSSSDEADRRTALACGCKAFFQKPSQFSELIDLLKELARTYCEASRESARMDRGG